MRSAILTTLAAAAIAAAALVSYADDAKKPERKPGPLPGKYAGEATCKKCHFKQSKTWKATGHAKAHEVLPAKYKDDASCVLCHATGAGQPGGFESSAKSAALAGVQCEMCHGPGADHSELAKANEAKKEEPAVKEKLRSLVSAEGGEACIRCHVMQSHGKHPDYEKETK
jgi:hypothetical protein